MADTQARCSEIAGPINEDEEEEKAPPPQPTGAPAAAATGTEKKSISQKLSEWGTNFAYKAREGSNILSLFISDAKVQTKKLKSTPGDHKVLLLGEEYDFTGENRTVSAAKFDDRFRSLVWITYRTNFPPLLKGLPAAASLKLKKYYTTDNGWGCSIRVGQMAVANALIRHIYGRGFSTQMVIGQEGWEPPANRFWDAGVGPEHPFSIQNIAVKCLNYKKRPGDWLGHSTVAAIMADLNQEYVPETGLEMLAYPDGMIYEDQIGKALENRRLVLFVSCTIGMKSPDPIYLPGLRALFSLPQLVGVMGARKKEALFFVGAQKKSFIFLDPHVVQTEEKMASDYLCYHCNSPKLLKFKTLDTCLTPVFYIESKESFAGLCRELKEMQEKHFATVMQVCKSAALDSLKEADVLMEGEF